MKQVFPRFLKPTTFFSRDFGLEFFSFPTRCLLYLWFSILLLSTECDLKKHTTPDYWTIMYSQPLAHITHWKYSHKLASVTQSQFQADPQTIHDELHRTGIGSLPSILSVYHLLTSFISTCSTCKQIMHLKSDAW